MFVIIIIHFLIKKGSTLILSDLLISLGLPSNIRNIFIKTLIKLEEL